MVQEIAKGKDNVGVAQLNKLIEKFTEKAVWTIRKFKNREDFENNKPYEISKIEGNILLNSGINELFTIICSSGGTKWDATNAYLGVGDSNTTENATQTDLLGTNKTYKGMVSGYPTYGTNQKATWKAQFTENEANYAWQEFVLRNGASSGTCLNRKVYDQGTKTSGQIWELTLEISLS